MKTETHDNPTTTGEHTCIACGTKYQDRPCPKCFPTTTDEWTVENHERYTELVDSSGKVIADSHQIFRDVFNSVASSHNAAVAAAVRQEEARQNDIQRIEEKTLLNRIEQLEQQLAAEREAWDKQFTATMTVLGDTQKQLAAEREIKAVTWAKGHDVGYREGVAAEREKVADTNRMNFLENCHEIRRSNHGWAVLRNFTNYEYDLFPTLREATDVALAKIGGK